MRYFLRGNALSQITMCGKGTPPKFSSGGKPMFYLPKRIAIWLLANTFPPLTLPYCPTTTVRNLLLASTNTSKTTEWYFDVLLTVHLSIFISVFNQLDAQNLFHSKFCFMPLHVLSTCAHHQEVKIAFHSLWYHHTETNEWSKIVKYNSINMSK